MISGFNHINLIGKFINNNEYTLTGENREKVKNAILNRKPIMLSFELDTNKPGDYASVLMTTSHAEPYYISSARVNAGNKLLVSFIYNTNTDSIKLFFGADV